MKSTIKLTTTRSITVHPTNQGLICVDIEEQGNNVAWLFLTQDQTGALIFALEQAAEAAEIAQDRATA